MAKVIETKKGWIVEFDGQQIGGCYPDMWSAISASPYFDFVVVRSNTA